MNKTNEYIINKYKVDISGKMPVVIEMSRFKDLTELFNELGFKVGVEIGVSAGLYSKWLLQKINGLQLYCVDPWEAYEEYVEQHDEQGQDNLNDIYDKALKRLEPFGDRVKFIRKYSMDAVNDFEDNSLDFVFIDGNHSFEYVVEDIARWNQKVKSGGIISGHDYWRSYDQKVGVRWVSNDLTEKEKIKLCQVKDAVIGWTNANRIRPWYITKGDSCPSWFWVKEDE